MVNEEQRADSGSTVSEVLAQFVAAARWDDLPESVRHEAKRSLLNGLASALAGCCEPALLQADRALAPFGGTAVASVIGRPVRRDPLQAAWLNAMAINVFDFDDNHARTIIHPTAPVAPVTLAIAEAVAADSPPGAWRRAGPVGGADLLLAFVLGVEVACRLGNAMSPGHYARGWHITSTCGVFGAAMAAGRLMGSTPAELGHALGHAAVQAAGLVEALGTGAKSLCVGQAARNGLASALLAAQGFDGPRAPLDGPAGYLRVASDRPLFGEITDGLGRHWEAATNTYKPYPCGVVLNPVLDACLALAAARPLRPDEIASIELTGHPLLRQRTDRPGVTSGRQAQVSAQHAVAVALTRGRAGLAEFGDDAVADPGCRAIGARLAFRDDESMPVEAANVVVLTTSGERLERHVAAARGSGRAPMTDAELEHKLRELAHHGGAQIDVTALIDMVWRLDREPDAGRLAALASGPNTREPHR